MKVLLVHTLYKQGGGEDQVVRNELNLLSGVIDVSTFYFYNTGNVLTTAIKFLFAINNFSAAKKLKEHITRGKPDLIHIHNWHFAASPGIIMQARKMRIPVIHTVHNYRLLCPSGTLFYNGKVYNKSLKGGFPWDAIFKKIYRDSILQTLWLSIIVRTHAANKTWSQIDRYIALTPFTKKLLVESDLQIKHDQIVVKPNFVEDEGFSTTERSKQFLFVGRLIEEKGIEVLISTFSRIKQRLIIIGDGPLKELVLKAAKENPNIIYKGKNAHKDIISEMKKCTALIFPSIWYEGMPMTILEAFSTATPVIASKLGVMETLVNDGENGLLFEPGDEKDLRFKVQKWTGLPNETKNLICLNARKSYEDHFTPEKNLEQLLKIYESTLNKAIAE